MDQKTHGNNEIVGNLNQVYHGRIANSSDSSGNLSNSDDGVALGPVTVINSRGKVAPVVETGVLNASVAGLGSSERVANEGTSDEKRIGELLYERLLENSREVVNGDTHGSMIVMNSGATSSVNGEYKDFGEKKELEQSGVINRERCHGQGDGEVLDQVEQGGSYWSNSVNGAVLETVILIPSEENVGIIEGNQRSMEAKGNEKWSSEGTMDESKSKLHEVGKSSSVIDMTCGGGTGGGGFKDNFDGERVCRICHLSSEGSLDAIPATTTPVDLIQLGCGCKDELGIAHLSCAEAWFKLKGSRICEICGETVMHITGVGDNRFLERRFISNSSFSSESSGGCWRGQPSVTS